MDGGNIQTFNVSFYNPAVTYQCDDDFQGGGWALVRRVKQGTVWHPATDNLAGFDVYGTYGSATSSSTFSVPFSAWVSDSTEYLFSTGTIQSKKCKCVHEYAAYRLSPQFAQVTRPNG